MFSATSRASSGDCARSRPSSAGRRELVHPLDAHAGHGDVAAERLDDALAVLAEVLERVGDPPGRRLRVRIACDRLVDEAAPRRGSPCSAAWPEDGPSSSSSPLERAPRGLDLALASMRVGDDWRMLPPVAVHVRVGGEHLGLRPADLLDQRRLSASDAPSASSLASCCAHSSMRCSSAASCSAPQRLPRLVDSATPRSPRPCDPLHQHLVARLLRVVPAAGGGERLLVAGGLALDRVVRLRG